jgi:transposase InsO family protein
MGKRGRKIMTSVRKEVVAMIMETNKDGVKLSVVCDCVGISTRTFQRWNNDNGFIDKREGSKKRIGNKISDEERVKIIEVCCSPKFRDLTPCEIIPILAEEGQYIASESTFYRILKESGLLKHRRNTKVPRKRKEVNEFKATGPNQIWSWDITYLKTDIKGKYYYLYLFMDIWSRKIVGWGIYEEESGENASELFKKICKNLNVKNVVLHSDNGNAMKSANMLATLFFLGVIPSFSRPRTSNDNAFSESLFKTLKYTAGYPVYFKKLSAAIIWMEGFENWYNKNHRHSMINYVTPDQRHNGEDIEILKRRKITYENAKEKYPERWSRHAKQWNYIKDVYLNKHSIKTEKNAC